MHLARLGKLCQAWWWLSRFGAPEPPGVPVKGGSRDPLACGWQRAGQGLRKPAVIALSRRAPLTLLTPIPKRACSESGTACCGSIPQGSE